MYSFNRYQLAIAGCVIGLALILTACLVARSGSSKKDRSDIKFVEPVDQGGQEKRAASDSSKVSNASQETKICVHIVGKVKSAGLYYLKLGSRVNDGIKAAGGASAGADLESINLAEKLSDGEQICIAPKGTIPPPATSMVKGGTSKSSSAPVTVAHRSSSGESSGRRSSSKLTVPGKGMVNINTASLEELQRLPGIGPSMAQRVLDYRTQNGRFKSVDELEEVRGIGPAKLGKLRPFVSL